MNKTSILTKLFAKFVEKFVYKYLMYKYTNMYILHILCMFTLLEKSQTLTALDKKNISHPAENSFDRDCLKNCRQTSQPVKNAQLGNCYMNKNIENYYLLNCGMCSV